MNYHLGTDPLEYRFDAVEHRRTRITLTAGANYHEVLSIGFSFPHVGGMAESFPDFGSSR